MKVFENYWKGLQVRERFGFIVLLILFYSLILKPWHTALREMNAKIPKLRTNLVWMRQQAEGLKTNGGQMVGQSYAGADQSLLSVVQQSASKAKVNKAIQQLVPSQNGSEVRVVLDDVNFNQWVRWVDDLFKRYGVNVKQVTAERDEDKPNVAEVRVTFTR